MINVDYFKTWSSNMAYILGFITGDGSIHYQGYNGLKGLGYKLTINLQYKDKEIVQFIQSEIAPDNKIHERKFGELLQSGQQRHQVSLVISSRPMMDYLIQLGVTPQKTGREVIPDTLPDEFFPDYLRGLFDADGSIGSCEYLHKLSAKYYTTYFWQIVSANKNFLIHLRSRLPFNVGGSMQHYCDNCYKWSCRKKDDIRKLYKYIYYTNDIFALNRKKSKFRDIGGLI